MTQLSTDYIAKPGFIIDKSIFETIVIVLEAWFKFWDGLYHNTHTIEQPEPRALINVQWASKW